MSDLDKAKQELATLRKLLAKTEKLRTTLKGLGEVTVDTTKQLEGFGEELAELNKAFAETQDTTV